MSNFKAAKAGVTLAVAAGMVLGGGPVAAAASTAAEEPSSDVAGDEAIVLSEQALVDSGLDAEVEPNALPVIGLPVILACVGTVGLSTYQSFTGGDPVQYITNAIIGCIPFGAAARPAVVSLINNNKPAIANVLRSLGAGTLASALTGDSAPQQTQELAPR